MLTSHCKETKQPHKKFNVDWFGGVYIPIYPGWKWWLWKWWAGNDTVFIELVQRITARKCRAVCVTVVHIGCSLAHRQANDSTTKYTTINMYLESTLFVWYVSYFLTHTLLSASGVYNTSFTWSVDATKHFWHSSPPHIR